MRYDPASYVRAPPWANTGGHGRDQPVSTAPPEKPDGAMSRHAAELDDWEDEGGATAGHPPESPCRSAARHFDEFPG